MRLPLSINARFLTQPQTGVQRYSLELLNALDDILSPGQAIAYCPPVTGLLVGWKNIQLRAEGWFRGNLWEQIDLPWLSRGTLLFSPSNIGPMFKRHQVVTIHDTSVFAYPQAYTWSFRLKYQVIFRWIARNADQLITVSEFSKHELHHWLGVPLDKISVTYEGHEHIEQTFPEKAVHERFSLGPLPFFIVVGSNSLHKNLKVVLAANELVDQDKSQIALVGGDFSKVFQASHITLAKNVKRYGYVSDINLRMLYSNAIALIFPSLYEGFGLPLLEAMACSCPVICSDIPPAHEVCGDSALYFDPGNPQDLSKKMQVILDQPALVNQMKRKGLSQSGNFSWEKTARVTKQILERYF